MRCVRPACPTHPPENANFWCCLLFRFQGTNKWIGRAPGRMFHQKAAPEETLLSFDVGKIPVDIQYIHHIHLANRCFWKDKTSHSCSWSSGGGCACKCASTSWTPAWTSPWSTKMHRFLIVLYSMFRIFGLAQMRRHSDNISTNGSPDYFHRFSSNKIRADEIEQEYLLGCPQKTFCLILQFILDMSWQMMYKFTTNIFKFIDQ